MKEKEERFWRWAIVALLAGALVLGYMFVLNGRFVQCGQDGIGTLDKWTHTLYRPIIVEKGG